MMTLWKTLLRSDLPSDLLDTMHFAVFGLGDSGYERFNWAAKKLQRRLLSLGALELIPRGDADDQDFYGWVLFFHKLLGCFANTRIVWQYRKRVWPLAIASFRSPELDICWPGARCRNTRSYATSTASCYDYSGPTRTSLKPIRGSQSQKQPRAYPCHPYAQRAHDSSGLVPRRAPCRV